MTFQIKEITLYKSGVGFFNGVCKAKEFILPVDEDIVDDVLKSLSIDGLQTVTFSAAEEKEAIQRKIGIAVDSNNAFASFVKHLIGLNVEITTTKKFKGSIIGVDYLILDNQEDEESGVDVLVIKDKTSINHIPYSEIKQLKILDEHILKDIDVFLDLEALTRKVGVINLSIKTNVDNATIQWVSPVSAWRLSYRVQFSEESQKSIFTGIAIVDNTTSIDWEKIKLRLVTGQPVSFKYDLHTPLSVYRPWVSRESVSTAPILAQHSIPKAGRREEYGETERTSSYASPSDRYQTGMVIQAKEKDTWDITRQVITTKTQAMTEELGAIVTYKVTKPITIQRSESSLLPLFTKSLKCNKCVVIREDRLEEAMDALLFNDSLDLEKGIGTIYLDDIYAGEAVVVRGSDYIAYRLNQDVRVLKDESHETKITGLSISRNIMVQKRTHKITYKISMLNTSDETIPVMLELNKLQDYDPKKKPTKESANYYRYNFDLKAGTTKKDFVFVKTYTTSEYIRDLNPDTVHQLVEEGILDDKNERIVMRIFNNLKKLTQKEEELDLLEAKIKYEFKNQERIRENIKTLQEIKQDNKRDEYVQLLQNSEQILDKLEADKKQLASEIEKLRDKI
ncbi:MAG: hypothetical protein FK733_01590 [Asgard group archaeon]|nr:hypothetical protein [Asgard group archaeon]